MPVADTMPSVQTTPTPKDPRDAKAIITEVKSAMRNLSPLQLALTAAINLRLTAVPCNREKLTSGQKNRQQGPEAEIR